MAHCQTYISGLLIRISLATVAFVVGWVIYMVAMMMTVYDGLLSMIFQPIMAAACSALFVGVSLLIGLLLRLPGIRQLWSTSRLWAAAILLVGLLVLIFGYSVGLTDIGVNPATGRQVTMLHPLAAVGGYFAVIFALTNFPVRLARASSTCHQSQSSQENGRLLAD